MELNNCIFLFGTIVYSLTCVSGYNLQPIGNFSISNPGFLSIVKTGATGNVLDDLSLYISSFNGIPFTTDHVYYIPKIGRTIQDHAQTLGTLGILRKTLTGSVVWPNEVNQVPDDVFGKRMLTVAGGFLVPSKGRGSIQLVDISHDNPILPMEITHTSDDHHWFYHRVLWMDMNGDGRKDAVTCRAKTSLFGGGTGELVWYEHPPADRLNVGWNHYVLGGESDTFFDINKLSTPDGSFTCIITTGFFSNQLKIYWTTDPSGQWTDNTKIKSRIIEQHIGHLFDVQFADLNNDGKLDLLVTTNGKSHTAVYAYEIPTDFRSGSFTKHTLMTGFHAHNILPGGGAPGSAFTVTNPSTPNGKPLILLSGDDDSHAYILSSNSESPTDWAYNSRKLLESNSGTVGEVAFRDVDGDGNVEIFVPHYSEGRIYIYRLSA